MSVLHSSKKILNTVTKPLLLYLISKLDNKEISRSPNQKSIWKLREIPQEAIEFIHWTKKLSGNKKKQRSFHEEETFQKIVYYLNHKRK